MKRIPPSPEPAPPPADPREPSPQVAGDGPTRPGDFGAATGGGRSSPVTCGDGSRGCPVLPPGVIDPSDPTFGKNPHAGCAGCGP